LGNNNSTTKICNTGDLTAAVLSRIAESDEKDIIAGFIYVDRGTGEYTKYKRGGVVWKSKDN
jgi:hypothetical protein